MKYLNRRSGIAGIQLSHGSGQGARSLSNSPSLPSLVTKWSTAGLVLCSMAGCVSWPDEKFRPNIPLEAKLPFVDQTWAATGLREKEAKNRWPRPLNMNDYKDSLRSLLQGVMASAEHSNDKFWDSGMTTLLGGAAGTLGVLSHHVGLTNAGLALAGGGTIAKTYYSPQQTREHHIIAHGKLACIATEISTLSATKRRAAMSGVWPGAFEASEALNDVAHSVDTVLNSYRRNLLGMAPQVSSRDDMLRFATDWRRQTVAAKKALADAGGDIPDDTDEDDDTTAPTPAAAAAAAAASAAAPSVAGAASAAPTAGVASAAAAAVPALPPAPAVAVVPAAPASAPAASTLTPTQKQQQAKRYAAQFVDLKVRMEACTKGPVLQ